MFIKYSSLEYIEFILAFQPQFGTYEAESEQFHSEKEKRHFDEWFSRQVDLLCLGYFAVVQFLKPAVKKS